MPSRPHCDWKLRTCSVALGAVTRVAGILNVTPDSFSDGGRFRSAAEAADAGLAMFDDGADIVDIGGESTRPGASAVISTGEEMDRVLPVIEAIRRSRPDALLSIDTYRAPTAEAAVAAGAEIVNDVSGMLWDEAMAATCARLGCGVIMMHTRGRPAEWRSLPPLTASEVGQLVRSELALRLATATDAGIAPEHIVLDPGFGFGKIGDKNYALLRALPELAALGHPLMAGVSRKSFLARTLAPLYDGTAGGSTPIEARDNATVAASTLAIALGASLIRVHEVRPAVEAARIADAALTIT